MLDLFLQSLGLGDKLVREVHAAEWLWARPRVVWIGLALMAPIGWWILRRHRAALPHLASWQRGVLTTTRLGVLALLVLVMGGPYLQLEETLTRKPRLAIAVDGSTSMTLPAGDYPSDRQPALAHAAGLTGTGAEGKPAPLDAQARRRLAALSRQELLEAIWNTAPDLIEALADRFELTFYRFGRRAEPAERDALFDPLGEPDGSQTHLGTAIERILADAGRQPLSGIVLLSDGQLTGGPDPAETWARQARAAAPVWAFPAGSDVPPADVSLLDVLAPRRLTLDETASIVATLQSHGFEGREVNVTLYEDGEAVHQTPARLRDGQRREVTLRYPAGTPGTRLLEVAVEPLDGEQVIENNRHRITLEVETARRRVLYLEGYPRWDFRFLDHALRRDPGFEAHLIVEASLEGTKGPPPSHGPEAPEGYDDYDVVLLGDISPDLLPAREQAALAEAVREDGLGLIVQAGPEYMPRAFRSGPLAELLPVTRPGQTTAHEAPAYAPFTMRLTPSGAIHPAFQLYDHPPRNRSTWNGMPPFYWAAGTGAPRPGATTLASVPRPGQDAAIPLITEHYAGRGRVIFLGLDATYRWRRNIGDTLFYRFWGQALRHVARTPDRPEQASWMAVHPPRIEPGHPVSIELDAVNAAGQPVTARTLPVAVRPGDAAPLRLESAGRPGLYRGRWTPPERGTYHFRWTGEAEQAAEATLEAVTADRERRRVAVDRDTLGALAEASGGALLELEQFAALPERLTGTPSTVRRVHEAELWDNWLTLLLLVGFYCLDVFIRRFTGVA